MVGSGPSRVGEKGTMNLRQDLSSSATVGSIEEACWGVPRRESKSEGAALGGVDLGEEAEEQEEREKEDGQCE